MSSPRQRIELFLRARLQLPLLSLLVLALIPSHAQSSNLVFTIVPAWESIKTLLSRRSSRNNKLQLQQWLSYWLLLAGTRVLENTRLDLDAASLSDILKALPSFILSKLHLPSRTTSPSSSSTYTPPLGKARPRKQTLAVKFAGSSTRWLVLKALLLFFAMDKEIQGANWLLHKVAKPLVAFFTSIEGPEDGSQENEQSSRDRRRDRRKESVAYGHQDGEALSGREQEIEQEEYIQTTPELSLDGSNSYSSTSSNTDLSSGGSGDTGDAMPFRNTHKATQGSTWESNHWTA